MRFTTLIQGTGSNYKANLNRREPRHSWKTKLPQKFNRGRADFRHEQKENKRKEHRANTEDSATERIKTLSKIGATNPLRSRTNRERSVRKFATEARMKLGQFGFHDTITRAAIRLTFVDIKSTQTGAKVPEKWKGRSSAD